MKINELIVLEETQVDELNLAGMKSALKTGAGAVGGALKTGARMAGQGIVKGAQAVAKNAPAIGQGVSNVAQGLSTAGVGLVKGAGDIASQAAGGIGQAALAGLGGAVRGYKTARSGGKFSNASWDTGTANPPSSSPMAPAAGNQELDQLKAQLQAMDQRLQKAGIAERKS